MPDNVPYCRNCGKRIRWAEGMGWVHGPLGGGWDQHCDHTQTNEAQPSIAYLLS